MSFVTRCLLRPTQRLNVNLKQKSTIVYPWLEWKQRTLALSIAGPYWTRWLQLSTANAFKAVHSNNGICFWTATKLQMHSVAADEYQEFVAGEFGGSLGWLMYRSHSTLHCSTTLCSEDAFPAFMLGTINHSEIVQLYSMFRNLQNNMSNS